MVVNVKIPIMDGDTGERPSWDVLLSARRLPSGALRVCVDRVNRSDDDGRWVLEFPVTFRDLPKGIDELGEDDLVALATMLLSEAAYHSVPRE